MESRLKVTFVGHVDHGKSTLIGRLLYDTGSVPPDRMEQIRQASKEQGRDVEFAYLMDHLKEERDQGITIDTAQIFFHTDQREYVIIDAPGHREFLKNMLTGASQAEVAIMMLDADEGVGEQTQRHAFLLTLLGIRRCLVAINKMDLVEFSEARFDELRQQVSEFFDRIGLEAIDFLPMSAKLGDNVVNASENMPWYDGPTLLDVLESISPIPDAARPGRFCVQDIYNFDNRRYIAGRVETGTLDADDELLALPDGITTRVLSIERFDSDRTFAEPGECIGVTLPDEFEPRRGQVLSDPDEPPTVTNRLRALLFWMTNEPMKKGDTFDLKIISQQASCKVDAIKRRINSSTLEVIAADADRLEEAEVAEVELSTSSPIVTELCEDNPALGRVILERDTAVVAAGIVIGL